MSGARATDLPIRPLKTWDEFLAAEELQRVVWQMPDWRDAVPANLMIAAAKSGGSILGAFDGEQLVGFAFSFLGMDSHYAAPILKHHSHMLAVLPAYQSRKLGARLKWAQREFACAQNIELMTWTYDPLLALNARLNLAHLGAIVRRYIPNAYGEMSDGLNVGLPSDRFEVEWWLNAPRVTERLERAPQRIEWDACVRAGAQAVFDVAVDAHALPRVNRVNELRGEALLVEIPANLGAVKSADANLAREWRFITRDVFGRAFAADYLATDFVLMEHGALKRAAYLLTRDTSEFPE